MGFLFSRRQNTLNNIRNLSMNEKVLNINLLKDEKLSCLTPVSIVMYDKELKIFGGISDESFKLMSYHNELINGDIIVGFMTGDISIYKYKKTEYEDGFDLIQTLNGHSNPIDKIIEVDEKIISCSSDKTMKIWVKENSNYLCTKTIVINDEEYFGHTNILKINHKEIVSSSEGNNYIKFWDVKNSFKEIAKIEDVNSKSLNCSMCMINDKILIMASLHNGIFIIDTIEHKLIGNYKMFCFYSVVSLSDGTILGGCKKEKNNHCLVQYKFENNDLIEINSKENVHTNIITGLVENSYGIIFSSSFDKTVKVFV